ncbi:MAG: dTMP kinase [Pseudomonadota bacterium]
MARRTSENAESVSENEPTESGQRGGLFAGLRRTKGVVEKLEPSIEEAEEKPGHVGSKPIFISFEGGEGSGKSTQAALLQDRLRTAGHEVVLTREPGGSPGGSVVREVILGGYAAEYGPMAEAGLLSSARRDHVEHLIRPALERGQVVLCDRFADSTRIYQGYVGGLPMQTIDALEAVGTDGCLPDLTLVFDVSRAVADQRRRARLDEDAAAHDRFEQEDSDFHDKVAEGFRWLCETYPERCVRIDADQSVEEVAEQIDAILQSQGVLRRAGS